jgi:cyclophilin family peptidyl-prolyl cis-trans isomerase
MILFDNSRRMRAAVLSVFALTVLASPTFGQAGGRGAQSASRVPATAAQRRALLLDPSRPFWSTHAPPTVTADIETSRGIVTIELNRAWAPVGVDHFYNLARAGYYDDSRIFRVIFGFIAQFGIAGDPAIANVWGSHTIKPDTLIEHNLRGTIAYAQFKPTDRTSNVFINMRDNLNLDTLKFTPIGRVVQGMDVVDSLYANYGELPISDPPLGNPKRLYAESNKYLDEKYPKLDRIIKITIRSDSTRVP